MYICPFFFVFKHLVIALFVLAVLLQSGFVAMHTVHRIRAHKRLVKQEMKIQLKSGRHNAMLTAFTDSDLKEAVWEHSREFFLNGNKYDVVRIVKQNGQTTFWCINDKLELELYKALDKEQNKQSVLSDMFKKLSLTVSCKSYTEVLHRMAYCIAYPTWQRAYQFAWESALFRPPAMV